MTCFVLLPRCPSSFHNLLSFAARFFFFPIYSSIISIISPWFCGCGFCSALSLTLPFTLALPVLPLHAVGRGGGSVGARVLVAHSHCGGSELREATLHPGKPLCLSVSLVAFLSHLTCSVTFSSCLASSPFSFLSLCDYPPLSFHCVTVCFSSLAHFSFTFHSPRTDLSLSIMASNYPEAHSF